MKVLIVTDPLCSWCWGMSAAVEEAAARLAGEVVFEFLLGGINIDSTQPVGDYGRRLLLHIWREVHATTGQPFGFVVPEGLVYNSLPACLAVAAVRRQTGQAPFGYLHRLQQLLFAEGRNTSDVDLLASTATEFGVTAACVHDGIEDAALAEALAAEFATSRTYGTHALPSVLIEREGERQLLAGGFADGPMLESLVRARLQQDA